MQNVLIVIAILAVVFLVYRVATRKVTKETKEIQAEAPKEQVEQKEESPKEEINLNKLSDLRLMVALAEYDIPQEVVTAFDGVVDLLVEIYPILVEKWSGHEPTLSVSFIVDQYLPETMENYAKMSQADISANKEKALASLATLKAELDRIKSAIASDQLSSFTWQHDFLRNRFGAAPQDATQIVREA